jgi:hypothetical protein
MREPLMTRWWTLGALTAITAHYLKFFKNLLAQAVVNSSVSKEKANMVASNFLSLTSSLWIVADVLFLHCITVVWLNAHFRWYQRPDPLRENSPPGFLSFHRTVRYFLMIEDLEEIKSKWQTMEKIYDKYIHTHKGTIAGIIKSLEMVAHNKTNILSKYSIASFLINGFVNTF